MPWTCTKSVLSMLARPASSNGRGLLPKPRAPPTHVERCSEGQRSAALRSKKMSRVIVKNVPPKTTEKALSELFSQCGEVTDAKLIRTRSGLSRRFGFVGLVSEAQAKRAVEMFDRSYIGTSRIAVEVAKPYGDGSLARPWSKYSKGSSAHARMEKKKEGLRAEEGEREEKKQSEKKEKELVSSVLSEYREIEEEPEFREFLSVHSHKSRVKTWGDGESERATASEGGGVKYKRNRSGSVADEELPEVKKLKKTSSHVKVKVKARVKSGKKRKSYHSCCVGGSAGESGCEEEDEGERRDKDEMTAEEISLSPDRDVSSRVPLVRSGVTDMTYLRSKMVKKFEESDDQESDDVNEEEVVEEGEDEASEIDESSEDEEAPTNQGGNEFSSTMFTLRMRGLPFRANKKDIEAFFHPVVVPDVRFTVDKDGRPSGRAYVDFNSEEDMAEALTRNGDCIGKRYIELFHDEGPQSARQVRSEDRPDFPRRWEVNDALITGEDETIGESGRLFLRNLSYTATEDHLTEAFEKFGPLTEVTVPLDKNTNRPTGLGFVTFMLPEHAVKAFEALDGQIFQGRLLHILPARPRRPTHTEDGEDDTMGDRNTSSFKQKKESEKKAKAGSSHNWNSLFLGANAVVDAMAQRYSTQKSSILDSDSRHSVAVRVALGETQLVSETREFLEAQGVKLDVFEQKKPKRSSTVMLVKNLPHSTTQSELETLFTPFGSLHRVILPPAGISALVEFLEPSHAKAAFKSLAYSKFKHLPLYLEWAPLGALEGRRKGASGEKEEEGGEGREEGAVAKEEGGEEVEVGEGGEEGQQCTVFVKNLNFTTGESSLKEVFSKVGGLKKVEIARKRNMKDPSHPLSMGFGFVEFTTPGQAQQALKTLQRTELDGHTLELKLSHRTVAAATEGKSGRKIARKKQQKSAKIMVRNVPFEASQKEVRELFQTFGQLKTVRLPKKMAAMGRHRGFGFVEFMTREDARRAFDSLCHSTHLYGRRLVLEWAEGEESVEEIRRRTAEHFHGLQGTPSVTSKRRKAEFLLYGNSKDKDDDNM